MVLAFFPLNYLAWIANWYNRYKERYLNMVSVYDFTCVDQQLHKLTVGHQELGDQVDVPVSKKWWNDWLIEVLWHCFLPSPSIALIRRRNPKLGEKFLQGCQRGRFTSIVLVPEVESEGRRTEMELGGFWQTHTCPCGGLSSQTQRAFLDDLIYTKYQSTHPSN